MMASRSHPTKFAIGDLVHSGAVGRKPAFDGRIEHVYRHYFHVRDDEGLWHRTAAELALIKTSDPTLSHSEKAAPDPRAASPLAGLFVQPPGNVVGEGLPSSQKSERHGFARRSSCGPRGAVRPYRLAPSWRHHQPMLAKALRAALNDAGNGCGGANLLHGAAGRTRSVPTSRNGVPPFTRRPSQSELPVVTSDGQGPCVRPADFDRRILPETCRVLSGIRPFRKPFRFLASRDLISLPACIRARVTHVPSPSRSAPCAPSVEKQRNTADVGKIRKAFGA